MSMSETSTAVPPCSADEIAATRARIQASAPKGWFGFLAYRLAALPLWLAFAIRLFYQFASSPSGFWPAQEKGAGESTALPPTPALQQPFPVHHEFITVNGIRLHAASAGRRPGKRLLLFVHGFPELWYSWRLQLKAFGEEYDAVAIDMRGYNDSDKPAGRQNYTLDVLASDIKEAVAALGHSSCTLVAHDWGGAIAWLVAGMYPTVVDRLVVMAGPHILLSGVNMTAQQAQKSWYILLFQAPWLPELYFLHHDAAAVDQMFSPGTAAGPCNPDAFKPEDIAWYRAAMQKPGAATALIDYYRALMDATTRKPIDSVYRALRRPVVCPVLVLWGDRDVALGTDCVRCVEAVAPSAEVHVLKECSHWIQNDRPEETNRLMRDFLARTDKTAAPAGADIVA